MMRMTILSVVLLQQLMERSQHNLHVQEVHGRTADEAGQSRNKIQEGGEVNNHPS
jgi:hypothetical protein